MENKKLVMLLVLFCFPLVSFAYDDANTHPKLTEEAIKLFNHYNANKIPASDFESIKKGSIDEDVSTRATYHFYDPVYKRGIYGYETSKKWANDLYAQGGDSAVSALAGSVMSLYGLNTDYTWDRAVYDYVYKDKQRGLEGLGHVLHLVEDAAVPDHTRNDDHMIYYKNILGSSFDQTSPYETYTTDPNDVGAIAKNLIGEGMMPIYSGLDEHFDDLAEYSNQNFFSRDTIFNSAYAKPVVDKFVDDGCLYLGKRCKFGINEKGDKLALQYNRILKGGEEEKEYYITDDKKNILSSYWSRLSKQAVLHSAGVIKLFFDAVEEEKRTGALAEKNKSWLAKAGNSFLAFVGLSGDKASTTPAVLTSATDKIVSTTTQPVQTPTDTKIEETLSNDQTQYLLNQIQTLQDQIRFAQSMIDPLADWPPIGNACPAK